MPLTKRQRRRLQEVSKMIQSSKTIKDDMFEIQQAYMSEINEVVAKIRKEESSVPEISSETDLLVCDPMSQEGASDSRQTQTDTGEHTSDANFEPIDNPEIPDAPIWAKKLWKRIAKKCHPDVLNFTKHSALEISRRQSWFLESKILFEKRSWNRFLHIGVQLEEWVDELTSAVQLKMLNDEYGQITKKVSVIQDSLAWRWGSEWDNLELRIKIITAVLENSGIEPPSRLVLVQILAKLELE